jgi:hypothetical protein
VNRIEKQNRTWAPRRGDANDAAVYSFTTFWQYADSGPYPGDQDYFNGDATGLKKYAYFIPFFVFLCLLRTSLRRDMVLIRLCIGWHLVENVSFRVDVLVLL